MKALLRITQRERYLLRALEIGLIIAVLICQAKALSISGTRMEYDIPAGESVNQLIKINGSDQQQYLMITTTNQSIQAKPYLLRLPPFTSGTVDIKATAPASGYVIIRAEKPGDKIAYGEEIRLTVCVGAPCPTPPTSNLSAVLHERNTSPYYTGTPTYLPTPTETINTDTSTHTNIWFMMAAGLVGAWIAAMITAFLMWRRKK